MVNKGVICCFFSIFQIKDMTIFIVIQIFFNKNDYYFSQYRQCSYLLIFNISPGNKMAPAVIYYLQL